MQRGGRDNQVAGSPDEDEGGGARRSSQVVQTAARWGAVIGATPGRCCLAARVKAKSMRRGWPLRLPSMLAARCCRSSARSARAGKSISRFSNTASAAPGFSRRNVVGTGPRLRDEDEACLGVLPHLHELERLRATLTHGAAHAQHAFGGRRHPLLLGAGLARLAPPAAAQPRQLRHARQLGVQRRSGRIAAPGPGPAFGLTDASSPS